MGAMEDREYAFGHAGGPRVRFRLQRSQVLSLRANARMGKSFDSSTHMKQFMCYRPTKKTAEVVFFHCGRWRNRTPTKGFGDLRSTTKLIALMRHSIHVLALFSIKRPPFGGLFIISLIP